MVNKKVLVCCGTGIATSVQVANKLQRMLRDRGVTATMKECKTANVSAQMTTFQPDAIVVTTAITPPDEEVKVYRARHCSPVWAPKNSQTRSLATSKPNRSLAVIAAGGIAKRLRRLPHGRKYT
ncbi:PTS system [Cutibacterium acnes JCM 18909]|nr:PTS system [Cutibacterium acnes JCM 18909]